MMLLPYLAALAIAQSAPRGPVILISWDGAGNATVQRLLREGKLPNLARLVRNGWIAQGSVSCWPSKTAASHMVAYSGFGPGANGVASNATPVLPRALHTILETQNGFDSHAHQVDPIWVHAAKHGKKVLVLAAWGSYPPEPDLKRLKDAGARGRYKEFSGFEATIAPAGVLHTLGGEARSQIAGLAVSARPVRDASGRFVKVAVDIGGRTLTLNAVLPENLTGWSDGIAVEKGSLTGFMRFRLLRLDPATGAMDLYHSKVSGMQGTESPAENLTYLRVYGAFHDDAFRLYESGELGVPAFRGGDGSAEKFALEIVRQDCRFLSRSIRYGISRYRPDLVLHYTPMIDSCGHTLMGLLDPASRSFNKSSEAKVRPLYDGCYIACDGWLGDVMSAAGPHATVCLISDHGMAGISRYVSVNAVLAKAGLLATANGKIDLARTKICAPPTGDFLLYVNGKDWKGGIVADGEREQVVAQAVSALRAVRDPETERPVFRNLIYGRELIHRGLVGPACGDIYLDLTPGYYPSASLDGEVFKDAAADHGAGVHGFDPTRTDMLATLAMGGAGIQRRGKLPTQNHLDIVPTLCRLMGIPSPTGAPGKIIKYSLNP